MGLLDHYRGRDLDRNVRTLGLTSFFQDVASEMVFPLLPAFLATLGGGPALLGAMESIAEAVLAFVKRWSGRASDRVGRRKPFVVAGYGLSTLGRPLLALATLPAQVIALRGLDRLAKGLRTAPRDALVSESTPAPLRPYAFAFHRGLDHLGAAVGPLVAALLLWLAPEGYRLVFALATLPALAGTAAVVFGVRERHAVVPTGPTPAPAPLPPLLLAGLFAFALARASEAFLLYLASDLGLAVVGLPLLWSGLHGLRWLLAVPAGRLGVAIGSRSALLLGWSGTAAVAFGFSLVGSVWLFLLLLVPYAFASGLVDGAEKPLVLEQAPGAPAGAVLGTLHLVTGLGAVASSLVFGLLWEVGSRPLAFAVSGGLATVACALLLASRTRTPSAPGPPPGPSMDGPGPR